MDNAVLSCLMFHLGLNTMCKLRVACKFIYEAFDTENVITAARYRLGVVEDTPTFMEIVRECCAMYREMIRCMRFISVRFDDKWRADGCQKSGP